MRFLPELSKYRTAAMLSVWVCVLSFGQTTAGLAHGNPVSSAGASGLVTPDTRARLEDIERRRKELQMQAAQARKKEQLALLKLSRIETKLNVTKGALNDSKHKLHKTETRLNETQENLDRTNSQKISLSDQAAYRLREIYEGQRLNLVEMVFQVQSLQALLDLFYYQERVADADRKLLAELKARAESLAASKGKLGQQKNLLGDLVSEFAEKALQITKEKSTQAQIADKLRNQRAFYEKAERQLELESQQLEKQIRDMESAASHRPSREMVQGSGTMSFPLRAQITSPFGVRRHPIFGVRKFHTGIDLAGPNHSAIRAADSGSVLFTGWYGGYGRVVIVSHGKGMATLYAHLSSIKVQAGDNVHKGDVIASEGSTGFSTGPHLHFEVRVNGKPNNPLNFVR
jgi:murein DD-endopeptidase MepM/ murein hydrolase activator NlpD